MVSPSAHRSSVFGTYSGPITTSRRAVILQPLCRRLPEERHRGDVVGDLRRHRLGQERQVLRRHSRWDRRRGDEAGHGRALGIPAEHNPGLGAVRRGCLDMTAGVLDPVDDALGELDAVGEIAAGFVVDRVHVERLGTDRCAQLVDERLPDSADAGLARRCRGRTPPRRQGMAARRRLAWGRSTTRRRSPTLR